MADLLISKLNQPRLIHHDLIPMGRAVLEPLRQREPLGCHLVPVVRIHELVVVHAVGRVPLHPLHRRPAAIQLENVIYETLASRRERQRFRWVRLVVLCWVGLADLEVLAWRGRGDFGGCDVRCVWGGGHFGKREWVEMVFGYMGFQSDGRKCFGSGDLRSGYSGTQAM